MNITIQEGWSYKKTLSSIIFRNRLEKQLLLTAKDSSQENIIFSFLFIQIFIEVFLHNKMRHIIHLANPQNSKMSIEWQKNEDGYIHDSKNRIGKISMFIKLFGNNSGAKTIKEQILERFYKLTRIRNDILHGHEISVSGGGNSETGESNLSAKLKVSKLKEILSATNELGTYWNQLIKIIFDNSKSLQNMDGFEFKEITIPSEL